MYFAKVIVSLSALIFASAQHTEFHQQQQQQQTNAQGIYQHQQVAPERYHMPTNPQHQEVNHQEVFEHQTVVPERYQQQYLQTNDHNQAYQTAPQKVTTVTEMQELQDHENYDTPAKYEFKYSVEDHITHDIKSHEESRDGHVVKGYYSLLQPDGKTRTVHYTADKHNGFQAQVEYSGQENHNEYSTQAPPAAYKNTEPQSVEYKQVTAEPVYKNIASTPATQKYDAVAVENMPSLSIHKVTPHYQEAPKYKVPAYPHF